MKSQGQIFILLLQILFLSLIIECDYPPEKQESPYQKKKTAFYKFKMSRLKEKKMDLSLVNIHWQFFAQKVSDGVFEKVITETIRASDFCVVGKIRVKNHEILDKRIMAEEYDEEGKIIREVPRKWKTVGDLEIETVVYGDPATKYIPFETLQGHYYGDVSTDLEHLAEEGKLAEELAKDNVWDGLYPEGDDTFIIFGKGQGKDVQIIRPVEPRLELFVGEDIKTQVESYRVIKNIESLPEKERHLQQQKLLLESNSIDLLYYLYLYGLNECGLERQMEIITTLFNQGKITAQRQATAYLLIVEVISKGYQNITPQQREVLNEIIAQYFVGIKTIKDGITCLQSFPAEILKKDNQLKERLKGIVSKLSRQFETDKDYPEWEKWVKKIFHDE